MKALATTVTLACSLLSCDAPTFYCGDLEHPSSCFCKADSQPCNGLGECARTCPEQGAGQADLSHFTKARPSPQKE